MEEKQKPRSDGRHVDGASPTCEWSPCTEHQQVQTISDNTIKQITEIINTIQLGTYEPSKTDINYVKKCRHLI